MFNCFFAQTLQFPQYFCTFAKNRIENSISVAQIARNIIDDAYDGLGYGVDESLSGVPCSAAFISRPYFYYSLLNE